MSLWEEVEGSVVGVASAASLCLAEELCLDLAGERNGRIIQCSQPAEKCLLHSSHKHTNRSSLAHHTHTNTHHA